MGQDESWRDRGEGGVMVDTETVERVTGRKMERSGEGERRDKEKRGRRDSGHRNSQESDWKEDGEIGEERDGGTKRGEGGGRWTQRQSRE